MFISVKFFLAAVFSYCKYLCVALHPSSNICPTPCFLVPSPDWLRGATYKLPWDATPNTPLMTGIPTYIYLDTRMDSLLTNQVTLEARVTEEFNMGLDE